MDFAAVGWILEAFQLNRVSMCATISAVCHQALRCCAVCPLPRSQSFILSRSCMFGKAAEFGGHEKCVSTLRWACDGSRLFTGSDDKTVKVWDVASSRGTAVSTLRHKAPLDAIVAAPHSPSLLVACADKKVVLWDLRSSESPQLSIAVSTTTDVLNAAWHPGGASLVAGTKEDVLAVADLRAARIMKRTKFAFEVNEFVFADGGSRIVASAGKEAAGSLAVVAVSNVTAHERVAVSMGTIVLVTPP